MTTMYDYKAQVQYLKALLEDDEIDQQTFADTLEGMEGDIAEKCEAYCYVIKSEEADRNLADDEMKRIKDFRDRKDRNIEKMKKAMQETLTVAELRKLQAGTFTVSIAKNGGKAPLVLAEGITAENVPEQYIKVKADIDKDKVREALEAGEALEWAHIGERGESLRIK